MAYGSATHLLLNGSAPVMGEPVPIRTTQVGELTVVSGAVCGCDPFVFLDSASTFTAPNGRHPVYVTVADLSEGRGSHLREAYLSVMYAPSAIARVEPAIRIGGEPLEEGRVYGAAVDAGTVSFADASAVAFAAAGGITEELDEVWFERMDDPAHHFAGVANIDLVGTEPPVNIVLCHSGWGDGFYPIIESFDADGRPNGIHIDLQVIGELSDEDEDED